MKKLMFTAAVALCAAVSANALESANVVGYDQTGLRSGAKGAGASFVPVDGASAIDIQSLMVTGYDEESAADVTAQTLDFAGRTLAEYTWYDFDDDGDVWYGWYNSDDELVESITIVPGESLYVRAPNTSFYVNFPGVTL